MIDKIEEIMDNSEYILIGIGMDFGKDKSKEEQLKVYNYLALKVQAKSYFVVTLKTDDLIYESEFKKECLVAPCGSEAAGNVVQNKGYDESIYLPQWNIYTRWLQNTLNQRLGILELGVGFQYPSVIRWPFEKTAYFNLKSRFVRIHPQLAQLTPEIKERSISITEEPVNLILEKIR